MGATIYAAAATGKIKRSDFGVSWNKNLDGGGVLVSDDVALEFNLEYGAPKAK
jgi:polyisoprenoid-binding protein YceI